MSQPNVNSTGVSQWLIHHAARHAPQSFAQRLEEEWLADLAERPSELSRLRFAVGCCWATQVIAREHQRSAVPVTGTVAGTGFASMNFGERSRRSSTLFWVVSLHAAVFYILMTTVLHVPKVNHEPLELMPTTAHRPEVLTIPTAPGFAIDIPQPTVTVFRAPDPVDDVTTTVEPQPIAPAGPPPESTPHQVSQVQGGPGAGFPNPDDFYPLSAKYLEEQGVATVQVCVDSKGRLTSVPTTLQGTGSARLDQAALKLATAGSGHYRASTEDGRPVNSCFPFRVRFQLKN
jgi:TonB family protein